MTKSNLEIKTKRRKILNSMEELKEKTKDITQRKNRKVKKMTGEVQEV